MGGSGGWWQIWPVDGGGAGGIDMVTIGQFDCERGCWLEGLLVG